MLSRVASRFAVVSVVLCAWAVVNLPAAHAEPALQWSVYITSGRVSQLAKDEAARATALTLLKNLNITKVFIEVFRGDPIPVAEIETVRDFFTANGFAIAGGIATVPGSIGVRQEGGLDWFNWQNEKTRRELTEIMTQAAPLFKEFIIDDFLCTGDISAESQQAKDDRDWPEYRRDLMVDMSENVFMAPARAANPDITMIIKFPQWYDLFHKFGYDLAREPEIYDKIWVGTETRGMHTQRFGFIQPYQGFINYRWIASIGGPKMAGAWFDHEDCSAQDFMDQAYQSVLAGAPWIMLFSFDAVANKHPGHDLLRSDAALLERLAQAVQASPVTGPVGYKPANSDPGKDMFIYDYIGTLGVPIVPQAQFPEDAPVIFLPAHAAMDTTIKEKIAAALARNATVIMTTGLLSALGPDAAKDWAGVELTSTEECETDFIAAAGNTFALPRALRLGGKLRALTAESLVDAMVGADSIPFFTRKYLGAGRVYVLNTRTFSQADYDEVNEVLLAPKQLGLIELPQPVATLLRHAFLPHAPVPDLSGTKIDAPARVTFQPLGINGFVLHNYNDAPVEITLEFSDGAPTAWKNEMLEDKVRSADNKLQVKMEARARAWFSAQTE